MRLLRLENNGGFSLEDFTNRKIPAYAILSHTWGPDTEEVTFKDLTERTGEDKEGYRKLTFCAKQAAHDGLQFFWADTCCIDKSSSSELSEAINSMFRYYQDAQKCYVYLSDVSSDTCDQSPKDSCGWRREFEKSRWFTRGWTLQELLAPRHVIFYNRHWKPLGTKSEHALWISKIAAIDAEVLVEDSFSTTEILESCSVAKRMSWASQRETTRTEDMAYCLLGIFNVNIPLLYGERERAFIRLQEEIMRTTCDDSILAW
ncbi:HET-domain-containing protein, partial [Pyrenochaeta sp. DS3sAY3a]